MGVDLVVGTEGVHLSCTKHSILSVSRLRVRSCSHVNLINSGKTKGDDLLGMLGNRVILTRTALRHFNSFTRVDRLNKVRVRAIRSQTVLSHLNISGMRGSAVDNKRRAHTGVTTTFSRRMRNVLTSRPADRLSLGKVSLLVNRLGTFSKTLLIVDRSQCFLSVIMSGV